MQFCRIGVKTLQNFTLTTIVTMDAYIQLGIEATDMWSATGWLHVKPQTNLIACKDLKSCPYTITVDSLIGFFPWMHATRLETMENKPLKIIFTLNSNSNSNYFHISMPNFHSFFPIWQDEFQSRCIHSCSMKENAQCSKIESMNKDRHLNLEMIRNGKECSLPLAFMCWHICKHTSPNPTQHRKNVQHKITQQISKEQKLAAIHNNPHHH